ncbi:DUF4870 domain-containing protein [Planosporangium flavigriseum]|nr:DUF4870 domain-containing protein [Planosporangium flavigriseum]
MTEPPRPPGDGTAGGYPPGAATPPTVSDDDRTWAMIAHFGGAIAMLVTGGTLGWVPPLIAYLVKGHQSPTVRAHSVNALNFQLFWSTISIAGYVLGICGSFFIVGLIFFLLPLAATLIGFICGIIAGIKAAEGELYRYPAAPEILR